MIKIYTSYFSYVHKFVNPVSISRYKPRWMSKKVPEYKILAPSKDLLLKYKDGIYDKDVYTKVFNEYLSTLYPNKIIEDLMDLRIDKGFPEVVLLCYEKPSDFCHRHLVAEHLNREINANITEYKFNKGV